MDKNSPLTRKTATKFVFALCITLAALSSSFAQNSTEAKSVQVVQLEGLEINEGLVTDEIARRFDSKSKDRDPDELVLSVTERIRGMFAASLAQQLSATKLLQLAVRDESLQKLQKEWQVSGELGNSGPSPIGVDNADYVATVRIEDFTADRKVLGNELAAVWKNSMAASFEMTKVGTGTKKVISESVSDGGKGRRGVGGVASDFDSQ